MNLKTLRVLAVMSVVVTGVIALLVVGKPLHHNLVVKAYFKDGRGLREGAKVRLAGIDTGTVKSV
jgi:ABC-type transporter Mla subunit MlaD